MTKTLLAALLVAVTAMPMAVSAQTATAEKSAATPTLTEQDVPHNGDKMAQVRARFGEPVTIDPAVGDPPITRWIYTDFTVYFEYEIVLHSVIHK